MREDFWTAEEKQKLADLILARVRFRDLALHFPHRSPAGVKCQANRISGELPTLERVGSDALREACLDVFQRTANRYQISMDDAMACHLGYCARPKEPGRAPAPLKTASAMRMAA